MIVKDGALTSAGRLIQTLAEFDVVIELYPIKTVIADQTVQVSARPGSHLRLGEVQVVAAHVVRLAVQAEKPVRMLRRNFGMEAGSFDLHP